MNNLTNYEQHIMGGSTARVYVLFFYSNKFPMHSAKVHVILSWKLVMSYNCEILITGGGGGGGGGAEGMS